MKNRYAVIFTVCVLLASAFFVFSGGETSLHRSASTAIVPGEIGHAGTRAVTPIRINSNADFAASPAVSGGSGTQADP